MAAIKGVLISCDGDMHKKNISRYTPIDVSCDDKVFNAEMLHEMPKIYQIVLGAPEIPRLVGVPILIRQYAYDAAGEIIKVKKIEDCGREVSYNNNKPGVFINVGGDLKDNFGLTSEYWGVSTTPGTVLVVRTDRKTLLPQHVEALEHLCQFGISHIGCVEALDNAMYDGGKQRKKDLDDVINGFPKYWEDYRSKKAVDNAEWRDVKSPLDTLA